jgi:hypothetical protein
MTFAKKHLNRFGTNAIGTDLTSVPRGVAWTLLRCLPCQKNVASVDVVMQMMGHFLLFEKTLAKVVVCI